MNIKTATGKLLTEDQIINLIRENDNIELADICSKLNIGYEAKKQLRKLLQDLKKERKIICINLNYWRVVE